MISRDAKSSSFRRSRHRGTAYLLVLGLGMLLSVVGVATLVVARLDSRIKGQTDDASQAALLAESGIEQALAIMGNDTSWRYNYTHNLESTRITLGRGTVSFKLVDQSDTDLSNDPSQDVRIYGIGRCGNAVRIYSVLATPNGTALDVLKSAAHSGSDGLISSSVTSINGPFSSNTKLTIISGAVVTGSVEAPTISNSGTITGTQKSTSVKTMPASSVYDKYLAMAVSIPYSSLSTGTMQGKVLSPALNPYGSASSQGVYSVNVPAGSTMTIRSSRIVGTLLVTLNTGSKFTTSGTNLIEPANTGYPTIIIKSAGSSATVDFNGSSSQLSEFTAGTNFNPPGTPYPYSGGVTDLDTATLDDYYPSEVDGIINVIGTGFTTTFGSNFVSKGAVIVEGPASYGNAKFTNDSNLYSHPPMGYTNVGQMTPVTGSWRWEKAP